jgi:hypothetical protein
MTMSSARRGGTPSRSTPATSPRRWSSTPIRHRAPELAGTWHVGVSRRDAGAFAAALAAVGDAPVLFALAPDPAATARLAWIPGQASAPVVARARTAGAPRVAANLLAVRVDAGRRGVLLLEDGPVLFLSAAQRDAAVAALQRGDAPTSGAPTSAPLMPWQIDLR